ncbi:uncharacterized protein LOC101851849 [Aplysia californica]|uniref:Uncharacterized protein LOC101851849 n=1 Tax=Aplysia californica TaxID=6500 RepID=A0ABM0JDI2_APLCA|nr:uncharacterized protein LOC101851849 [Aplysia californica]
MLSARNQIVPYGQDDELKRRLEKLSRSYDLTTMKIFMTVEALGEANVYSTYDLEKKVKWDPFLTRREACRLDLTHHDKTREKYQHFLNTVGREQQGKQFYHSMMTLLREKGVVDLFPHNNYGKHSDELDNSFCGHFCKLFDRKFETWFDSFQAINIRLTAHVKVSNFVRVLTGQVDLLCRKDGILYAINVKVTGMASPRPMDVNELCLVKAMVIQNGLAAPDRVICALLVCHLGDDRPVLRLWEYKPTTEMDRAIRMADIDNMIDAGKLTQFHEMWKENVVPPGSGSQTARLDVNQVQHQRVANGNVGENERREQALPAS